ncbi:MAG: Enoyl-CoA hydratase/carnithine racemase [Modestobacter sp.]|nr:Enoyl-CoA hydratase/carnithine racemase [Modestobacter sp.]
MAAEPATFAFTEVRIGVVPAVISAVVLPRMLPNVAHRLMLTGEVFNARTALAGGLVDLLADADEVDDRVAEEVTALAAGGPQALAATKVLLRSRNDPLAERFPDLLALSARFFTAEEGQEGIAAFREKRPARWVPA